jgi:hypothetical protein
MASTIAELKRNRKNSLSKLREQVEKMNSKSPREGAQNSELFWKPTRDKTGNGFAIIRFLPEPAGEDFPFIQLWSHAFQGPGGWYIENSRTTLGKNEKDPVSELNQKLWNSVSSDDAPERKQARKQKRNLSYISNIYVIKDSANPENEGKVFLFKYGKKIFDMLNSQMNPEFEDESPVDPFDLWDGANFRLKIRTGDGGYPNYDKSEFDSPGPLLDDEDEMDVVWKQAKSLKQFVSADQFKSYDDLKARLNKVLGLEDEEAPRRQSSSKYDLPEGEEEDLVDMLAKRQSRTAEAPAPKAKAAAPKPSVSDDDTDGDDDEDLEYFKNLAARSAGK